MTERTIPALGDSEPCPSPVEELLQAIWDDPACLPCGPCRQRISTIAEMVVAAEKLSEIRLAEFNEARARVVAVEKERDEAKDTLEETAVSCRAERDTRKAAEARLSETQGIVQAASALMASIAPPPPGRFPRDDALRAALRLAEAEDQADQPWAYRTRIAEARLAEVEEERDEALARGKSWQESQQEWKTLAGKLGGERDAAEDRLGGAETIRRELVDQLTRAEARLAETQEALERIVAAADADAALNLRDVAFIARAALTTHHTEGKP